MADETTDALETENAEVSETTGLEEVGAIVEDIAAAEQAEDSDAAADTGSTGEDFTPTPEQVEMAKQLKMTDEEIDSMTEAEAFAVDKVARKESRRQQRKGSTTTKADEEETSTSADSSTDGDEFKEDDWYTDDGRKKINQLLQGQKEQKARDAARSQETQTSESERLKAEADKVFDSLDPEIFKDFSPGETDDIGAGSPAELKRNEVTDMAEAIQNASKTDISREDAIGRALAIVAPTETENAALNEANDRRRTRGSQRVGSPASSLQTRIKTYDSPEEEAIDVIHAAING